MPNHKQFRAARKYGYRSGLEHKLSLYLDELKVIYDYEKNDAKKQNEAIKNLKQMRAMRQ